MKVVILAGGFGSRIAEESHLKPKPMIEVGGRPILWHIMKGFAHFGFNDFVIAAGYRQEVIKEYFANFYLHSSDVTFDYRSGKRDVHIEGTSVEPWRVTVADTGLNTMTAGRIRRIHQYIGDEPFFLTYGDGVSDLDPNDVVATHREAGGVVTLTGVEQPQRYGVLETGRGGVVSGFREKGYADGGLINGGFMVCEPRLFAYLGEESDSQDFSGVTLERLAHEGSLTAHVHRGFWQCMDTARDKKRLEELWASGKAPWKVW